MIILKICDSFKMGEMRDFFFFDGISKSLREKEKDIYMCASEKEDLFTFMNLIKIKK